MRSRGSGGDWDLKRGNEMRDEMRNRTPRLAFTQIRMPDRHAGGGA